MLRKFQLLKQLCIPASKAPWLPHKYPLQALNLRNISNNYSFSTFHNKDHLSHLKSLPSKEKSQISKALDKYATHKEDLTQLASDEVKWLLSGLSKLYLHHMQDGYRTLAFNYLSEKDEIFKKLGIKDTIDVALNYYDMSSNLISQEKFEEAEKCLNEVSRICKLLGSEDARAKSLTAQSWHLMAQIESPDKALELYNAVLENINHINEPALPAILPSVHQGIGRIYRSRGDIDNMIKSYKNALQAVIKYFGENSAVDFNFLSGIVDNLALQGEPSAENRTQMALKPFPNPHMKVGIICCLIGNIYLANKKYPQAVDSFHEASKIFEKLPQDCSSLLYDVYFSMAKAIETETHSMARDQYRHRYRESPNFLAKAEEALIKANPEPNLSVAAVYERWAKNLNGFDIFATFSISKSYSSKAAEIYKNLDPENNRTKIFSNYLKLGRIDIFGACLDLKQHGATNWYPILNIWKEAEKYLDPTDHSSVQEVYVNLDFLYSGLENSEESERCVQKLLQSCEATGDTSYVCSAYEQNGELYENYENVDENYKKASRCYETAKRVYEKEANKDPAKVQNLETKISQIKEKLQMKKEF